MTVTGGPSGSGEDKFHLLNKFSWFANEDQRRWWEHTGPRLLRLLSDSQYPEQYQLPYLYLLQQRLVPYLGVFPTPGQDSQRWWSNLTPYGVPFEFSWNLLHDIVRISFDPVSHLTGTEADAFNKIAAMECLSQLASLDKDIDLTQFKHFQRELTLTLDEETRLLQSTTPPRAGRGQHNLAVELNKGGISAKAYFYPGMKSIATGIPPGKLFFDAIDKLGLQTLQQPIHHLRDFLGVTDDGILADKAVTPMLLGCDLCDPDKSRIKFYVTDQMVTWDRVADMWTLGGRRLEDPQCGKGLALLKVVWDLLKIPEGYRGDVWPDLVFGTPPSSNNLISTFANWTLSPKKKFPEPQIYLVTFGMNDAVVMDALIAFYKKIGWTDLARTYKDKVASHYPGLDLTQSNHVHEAISFSYRNGKPYLSVYYSPF
ncbi:12-alpha,13-alpha-dihydroxyfumitremorgin C prenyltransferase [Aspergillus arachidicola]|uniref:12-alpha,13-alpha-dihydroxyfumitremorgin C prenyltransferase n=1 Tax=Aspergillus arachidicola TaxID=656916 RepID=A0A5N6YKV4_9EURO|nr:12-alpha,13-alpha-dihydroxyfumitremorgin C prenyltransferase [Aspergillus arachidicola]